MVRVVPDESCALAEVMLNCVPCIVIAIASRKDNNTEVHRYVFWGGHFQFTTGVSGLPFQLLSGPFFAASLWSCMRIRIPEHRAESFGTVPPDSPDSSLPSSSIDPPPGPA